MNFCKAVTFFTLMPLLQLSAQDSIGPESHHTNRIIKYKKLQIGLVGDVNLLVLKHPGSAKYMTYRREFGGGGGIHLQYNIKRQFALTLNCLYEQKNWESSPSSSPYYVSENRLHTFTLPLLFKFSPFKRNFFIAAGPYLGIVHKKEVKGYEEGIAVYDKPFEGGAALGMGFSIPVSSQISILLEVRDYVNLTTAKSLVDYLKMNTPAVQMGLFYKFGKTSEFERKTAVPDSAWEKQKKVFVKLYYSPHLSFRSNDRKEVHEGHFFNYDYGGYSLYYFIYDPSIEIPKLTFDAGMMVEFRLSKHFNMSVGHSYCHEGYSTKRTDFTLYHESQYPSSSNPIERDTSVIRNHSIDFNYYFVNSALHFTYQSTIKKLTLYIGAGIQFQALTGYNLDFAESDKYDYLLKNDELEERSDKRIKARGFYYTANVGVSYPVWKKIHLFLEPDFKKEIGQMANNTSLWSAGCKVGLKF